jgi:hypothetical protein
MSKRSKRAVKLAGRVEVLTCHQDNGRAVVMAKVPSSAGGKYCARVELEDQGGVQRVVSARCPCPDRGEVIREDCVACKHAMAVGMHVNATVAAYRFFASLNGAKK